MARIFLFQMALDTLFSIIITKSRLNILIFFQNSCIPNISLCAPQSKGEAMNNSAETHSLVQLT